MKRILHHANELENDKLWRNDELNTIIMMKCRAKSEVSLIGIESYSFRKRGFRFAFFSNEESRIHIHVYHGGNVAKFWLEPTIELAQNHGLRPSQIRNVLRLIEEHEDEIKRHWETTLDVEVTQIDMRGIWVLIDDKEYFLPFEKFPLFRNATVRAIHNVRLLHQGQLHWPELDLDVAVESLGNPDHVPLLTRKD